MTAPGFYPLKFQPLFKERVWGGGRLRELFGKNIPAGAPIGESWEISDRPGDSSIVINGEFAGRNINWLMQHHARDLLPGTSLTRFPLLVKILDAREKLSLQVHPPAAKAAALGGESKTEMWYIAHADPGAELYVGLRNGVTQQQFQAAITSGTVDRCFHRVSVQPGDVMFLPSGRVHAIGAGLVIFEIQQNSDTTYRVFDWNRCGLDGRPRTLHISESLEAINFNDFEPALVSACFTTSHCGQRRILVQDPLFSVEEFILEPARCQQHTGGFARILGVVSGEAVVHATSTSTKLRSGEFCLIPGAIQSYLLEAAVQTRLLDVAVPG